MDCKIVKVQPNTEQWLRLRRGRLTASHAGDWIAKPTTKRYQQYREQIVLELLGYEEEEEDAPWMQHGRAMEPYARGAYEWQQGITLNNEMFLIHNEHDWLGASPDGVFPDNDGMVEIKCRNKLATYQNKLATQERVGNIDSTYRPQVQCQLLVSGLPSVDFVNYYHDEEQRVRKMHIYPVERDEALIGRIEEQGLIFITECYKQASIHNDRLRKLT